jgi:pectin methylesterase-like acyl-CoA thioesterase
MGSSRTLALGILLLGAGSASSLAHKKFDFVVGVDGDFKAAKAAAAAKASSSYRFHIFFPDGQYDIGTLTGDANQMSTFPTANVSFIGQSEDKTVIFNKSINEGISITATLNFDKADNLYLQDLSILNKANYGNTATYNETGRHVAVLERASKVVYKNVRLLSTQDTYYTKGTRTYWEGGQIHGTTDFICGGGDVFFNEVLLFALKKSAMTAPATNTTWGYVFKNCTIDGNVSGYDLGRSWGDARAVFLNTTMKKLPSDLGWGNPMNSVPKVFAEYQSRNASGGLVDLSKRRTTYTKDAVTVTLKPVLTDAEAAKYTVAAVLGGTDNWQPQALTKQMPAPVARQEGAKLVWADNVDALGWVVFRNGKYLANVATPSLDISKLAVGDLLTVRAANAMGGLGASSAEVKVATATGIADRGLPGRELTAEGRVVRLDGFEGATLDVHVLDLGGRSIHSSRLDPQQRSFDLSGLGLGNGVYLVRASSSTGDVGWAKVRIVD